MIFILQSINFIAKTFELNNTWDQNKHQYLNKIKKATQSAFSKLITDLNKSCKFVRLANYKNNTT